MAHVLITGAGPAGASLACLLAHRGIQVTLLERQQDFAREFRGEFLMPSGVLALEQMGLGPALATVPSTTLTRGAFYLSGRLVFRGDVDPDEASFDPPRAVSQPHLLEAIVAEAGKSPGFRLVRGATVKDLCVENDRVVGVHARTEDGEQELRADLVVGADGRGSSVRRRGGLEASKRGTPMDIVWCKIPCPESWSGVRFYAGRGHLLAGYRTWDGSLQIGWVILKGTFGELRSRGIEQWVEEMANHVCSDFAAHLRAHAGDAAHPFLLSTLSDCVEHWSAPGLLVIGDAAHTMSPVAGQGVNIALRDTIVAANHLVPVLSQPVLEPERLDAALRAIEDERMPEVSVIQDMQAQPPRLLLSRAWWGEPVRRLVGTLVGFAPVRALAERRIGAFPFGVTEVRLSV